MKTKKCLSIVLAIAMVVCSFTFCVTGSAAATKNKSAMNGVSTPFNIYTVKTNYKLYFKGKSDIPYVSMDDVTKILASIVKTVRPNLKYTTKIKGSTYRISNNSGSYIELNTSKNTLTIANEQRLFKYTTDDLFINLYGFGSNSEKLFELNKEDTMSRLGKNRVYNLGKYGIKPIREKKKFYIPLQTLSDTVFSIIDDALVYNGKGVCVANLLLNASVRKEFMNVPKKTFSKEYGLFNYNELCMFLDSEYGLKKDHNISSFDEAFKANGFKDDLSSTDTKKADKALGDAICSLLDDNHSRLFLPSFSSKYADEKEANAVITPRGVSYMTLQKNRSMLLAARNKYNDTIKPYYELGDTAYITVDSFSNVTSPAENYTVFPEESKLNLSDTVRLMQYACKMILRDGSPIKNVVMDLSLNNGGEVIAGEYTIGTFLGQAYIPMYNTTTKVMEKNVYHVDTNLDGVFDEKDTLAGKGLNLYCICSGYTYSCANLVTNILKDSGKITIIGQTSAGGTCKPISASTAFGSVFRMSSSNQISLYKNGSMYGIDRGAEPHYQIGDMSKIYDRQYMNKYISNLG